MRLCCGSTRYHERLAVAHISDRFARALYPLHSRSPPAIHPRSIHCKSIYPDWHISRLTFLKALPSCSGMSCRAPGSYSLKTIRESRRALVVAGEGINSLHDHYVVWCVQLDSRKQLMQLATTIKCLDRDYLPGSGKRNLVNTLGAMPNHTKSKSKRLTHGHTVHDEGV